VTGGTTGDLRAEHRWVPSCWLWHEWDGGLSTQLSADVQPERPGFTPEVHVKPSEMSEMGPALRA